MSSKKSWIEKILIMKFHCNYIEMILSFLFLKILSKYSAYVLIFIKYIFLDFLKKYVLPAS